MPVPRESGWVRLRRAALLLVIGVLTVTGGFTVADRILAFVRPPATSASSSTPTVSDTAMSGWAAVVATDYLSWDSADKTTRQTALARYAPSTTTVIDGWDGTGRQSADAAQTIAITRGAGDSAVATVRVRVTPYAGAPAGSSTSSSADADGNAASQPMPGATGWTALPGRWVTLAMPLAQRAGRMVVTTTPALVGSPPTVAPAAAVADGDAGDDGFAAATKDTVSTLLRAYATGQLDYARAAGTTFAGLASTAALDSVQTWRAPTVAPGAQATTRTGDATVTWALSGGAGKLTCSYLITLQQQDQRWFLAAVSPETEGVSR
ncbi:conjugal transfer protein [Kutzneria sp. 744]|uniref:conjugal transfer protein n=1 Tax=Kutzneria sp. (strain 744) TaxID=345341 RepID=UPI0018DCDA68|nr:conjugal transfer protein [Kutzneria sp. 744]